MEHIVRAILAYAEENGVRLTTKQQINFRSVKRWTRPLVRSLKLNCDAAFNPEDKSGGWGYLIRDSDGDVVLAGWGRVNHLLNVAQAEAITCLQGYRQLQTLGLAA